MQIAIIQSRLLDVGSAVATPPTSTKAKVERVRFDASSVDTVERWLDEMDDQLPPLTQFILPSGELIVLNISMLFPSKSLRWHSKLLCFLNTTIFRLPWLWVIEVLGPGLGVVLTGPAGCSLADTKHQAS